MALLETLMEEFKLVVMGKYDFENLDASIDTAFGRSGIRSKEKTRCKDAVLDSQYELCKKKTKLTSIFKRNLGGSQISRKSKLLKKVQNINFKVSRKPSEQFDCK